LLDSLLQEIPFTLRQARIAEQFERVVVGL